jgi:hypothetical protein
MMITFLRSRMKPPEKLLQSSVVINNCHTPHNGGSNCKLNHAHVGHLSPASKSTNGSIRSIVLTVTLIQVAVVLVDNYLLPLATQCARRLAQAKLNKKLLG